MAAAETVEQISCVCTTSAVSTGLSGLHWENHFCVWAPDVWTLLSKEQIVTNACVPKTE